MTITSLTLNGGYLACGRGRKRLGIFEREWEAQAAIDAEHVAEMPSELVRIGEWLSAWRVLFPGRASQSTREFQRYMVQAFVREYGDGPVREFTALQAQAWALANPWAVKFLGPPWRKAVLMGVADVNVWQLVELPPRKKAKRRPPTLKELDVIVSACGRKAHETEDWWWVEFADLIEVAAYTGARQGGLIGLARTDVAHKDPGLGTVPQRMRVTEKGGKTRWLAVTGRGRYALARALARQLTRIERGDVVRNDPVFRSLSGCRLTSDAIGTAWRQVRGDFPGPFHSLRHFAATWLAEWGVDREDIAIQLGHTDSMGRPYTSLLKAVYVHPDPEDALVRIEAKVGS